MDRYLASVARRCRTLHDDCVDVDRPARPMNPTILHFSRAGNALKSLFFLGLAAAAFWLTSAMLDDRRDRPPPTQVLPGGLTLPVPTPPPNPFAPLKILVLLAAGSVSLFCGGRRAARALSRAAAIKIEGGRLHFHPSFGAMPATLPVEHIDVAIFDRADRLPEGAALATFGFGSGAAKFGARTRHGLYLHYRQGSGTGEARIIDNDVDGGVEQLRRFAAQVDLRRHAMTVSVIDCAASEAWP